MYLGIDLHKQDAQMAVRNDAGDIVEEVRVKNANLDEVAQRYAGATAVIKATSNYYHIYDTLSEYLNVTVAHPSELKLIANTDTKTDRVDAKELSRILRVARRCWNRQEDQAAQCGRARVPGGSRESPNRCFSGSRTGVPSHEIVSPAVMAAV